MGLRGWTAILACLAALSPAGVRASAPEPPAGDASRPAASVPASPRWDLHLGLRSGALAATAPAAASAAPDAVASAGGEADEAPLGRRCIGRAWRFPNASLASRIVCDLVAIPQWIVTWNAGQWALGAGLLASGVVLMLPLDPSLDARMAFWVRDHLGADRKLWTPLGSGLMWAALWALPTATTIYGWSTESFEAVEYSSLMVEALAVSRAYQLVLKLAIGREGPRQNEGLGVVHGPFYGWALFPQGTPSGHATSIFALLGMTSAYFDDPWLTTVILGVGLVFDGTILMDRLHFVSDVIWGSALGWVVGRWVVANRRALSLTDRHLPEATLVPWADPARGAAGLALTGRF